MRSYGIQTTDGARVTNCAIWNCANDGIYVNTNYYPETAIVNNTINNVQGHGITLSNIATVVNATIYNNIFSNNTGGSKYAINVAAGSAKISDMSAPFIDYNCFYNNTSNYNGISAGAHDTTGTDPGYTAASTGNFTIGTALKALGWPGTVRNSGGTSYTDPGAFQRQEVTPPVGGLTMPRSPSVI
jgi:hypothetical protein